MPQNDDGYSSRKSSNWDKTDSNPKQSNWDKQQTELFNSAKSTERVGKGGLGSVSPDEKSEENTDKLAEAVKRAREKALALRENGAYKKKRPDLLIAKYRRRIHVLKTIEDKNFLEILLGQNAETRRKLETDHECRIIVKQPPDETICLCLELEGESEDRLSDLIQSIKILLFDGKDPVQGIFQVTDEKGENQNKEQLLKQYTMEEGEIRDIYKIPNNMVGLIIGRQGETIKELISKCRAHIQVQRDIDTPQDSLYREIVITGDRYSVDEAKKEIQDLITRKTTEVGVDIPDIQGGIVKQITIPNEKVGLIIGRGGEHHRCLMHETGTAVIIPPAPDIKDSSKRTITIKGPAQGVKLCAEKIMAITRGLLTATAVDAGTPYITIKVPNEKVGIIIGKGGVNLKEIQMNFGVKLQIPQLPDPDSNPPTRTLTIYGDPEMTTKAKDDIMGRLGGIDMSNYLSYIQQMGYTTPVMQSALVHTVHYQSGQPMPYPGYYPGQHQQMMPGYNQQPHQMQQPGDNMPGQQQPPNQQNPQAGPAPPAQSNQDLYSQWVQYYISTGMSPQDAANAVNYYFSTLAAQQSQQGQPQPNHQQPQPPQQGQPQSPNHHPHQPPQPPHQSDHSDQQSLQENNQE